MKPITDKETVDTVNAWGNSISYQRQTFQIEESDVGKSRPNYLGYCQRAPHSFKPEHVGRRIIVMTDDTHWTCWLWADIPPTKEITFRKGDPQ